MKRQWLTLGFDGHRLNARSIRQVFTAMKRAVDLFAEERKIRFRGRDLGHEAYINVAVWHMTEMDREEQAQILKTYLPRLEAFLVPETIADRREDREALLDVQAEDSDSPTAKVSKPERAKPVYPPEPQKRRKSG